MRLEADDVTSVGTVGPTHVLPGARDAGWEGRLMALSRRDVPGSREMWRLPGMRCLPGRLEGWGCRSLPLWALLI